MWPWCSKVPAGIRKHRNMRDTTVSNAKLVSRFPLPSSVPFTMVPIHAVSFSDHITLTLIQLVVWFPENVI